MKLFYYLFSLLIIAVALFLLMTSVVIPTYQKNSFDYQLKTAMDSSWVIKTAVRQYYKTNHSFGSNNNDLGLDESGAVNDYVLSSFNNNGKIILQLGNEVKSDYKNSLIIYTPEIKNNNIYWTCSTPDKNISLALVKKYC
jgi:type II secretory pathway pseudopilin PulG